MKDIILIIGANGQLGWELARQCRNLHLGFIGLDLPEYDVTDYEKSAAVFREYQPWIVINASAYTAVDKAEEDYGNAYKVNQDGPLNLARCCRDAKIPLIHISTDYVFNGKSEKPYKEDDPVSPLGVYGKSKEAGECEVRQVLPEHIIIRTSWVYGVHGNNFVKIMLRLAHERDSINVVNDQYGCPTSAKDLAEAVLMVSKRIKDLKKDWGTYHFCGSGVATWYGLADYIIRCARKYQPMKLLSLNPVSTSEYPTLAERPRYTAMDCRKIEQTFHIKRNPWKHGVQGMLAEFLGAENQGS